MKIVGVTSCIAGLAHTPMAAKALEKAGAKLGHDVRMEQQGAMGKVNEITEGEIKSADLVLIAAGFLGSEEYVTKAFGVEVNARTNVATPAGEYHTNVERVFTAGDMRRGQSLVVWAIREGREAAQEIDVSLMGYTNMNVQ